MKKILLLTAMFIFAVCSYSYAADGVKWFSLQEGFAKAKAENKPCIVDFFYGKGCPFHRKSQRETYIIERFYHRLWDPMVWRLLKSAPHSGKA